MKVIITTLFWLVWSMAHAQEALDWHMTMFPNATVPPPIIATGADGKRYIPGWANDEGAYAFYRPTGGQEAGYVRIIEPNDGYTIDSFLDVVISEADLVEVDRPSGVQSEAFKATFGPMVAGVFGKATHQGNPVHFFADLYGPDDEGLVHGSVIFGTPEIFESWDGVLLPLVQNGYVKDPSMFDDRAVFLAGSDAEKTKFYVDMVNTKVTSDMSAYGMLSEGALQAARNAATIASCEGASNCTVSYDGAGNAVADFDQE